MFYLTSISAVKIISKNLKNENIFLQTNTNSKISTEQLYSSLNLSPLQAFLEAVSNHNDPSFCIKIVIGYPMSYKSYSCPPNMKIYDDSLTVCQKDCPKGMVLGPVYCETPCKKGFVRSNDLCVDSSSKKQYKTLMSAIEKSNPVCINGYFLNGYCHSCMGHSDYSNGSCLTPCNKGAPSESFCAFADDSNRDLSSINSYWAHFIRIFYANLLSLFKTGYLKRTIYAKAKTLNDLAKIITDNKSDNQIQVDCGIVMIYLRDTFGINMDDSKQYLRNNFFKMFSRYAAKNKEDSNDILNVVDDLINFNGDYKSPYLETKHYGIVSLPLTVANIMQHLCKEY